MKASHRKDVIIARIIFAIICAALLAGIISAGRQQQSATGNGTAAGRRRTECMDKHGWRKFPCRAEYRQ